MFLLFFSALPLFSLPSFSRRNFFFVYPPIILLFRSFCTILFHTVVVFLLLLIRLLIPTFFCVFISIFSVLSSLSIPPYHFVLLFLFLSSLFPTIFRYPLLFMLRSFSCLYLHFMLYFPFCLCYAPPILTFHVFPRSPFRILLILLYLLYPPSNIFRQLYL